MALERADHGEVADGILDGVGEGRTGMASDEVGGAVGGGRGREKGGEVRRDEGKSGRRGVDVDEVQELSWERGEGQRR